MALIVALEFVSSTALGYDPTIERFKQVDSEAVYRIQVPVKQKCLDGDAPKYRLFETENLLFDAGAEAVRGRGTRVWKVREVVGGKPTGPLMVLKDSFVNEDRPREGKTTKKIVESLPEGDKRRLNFLTVVVHGDVVINDRPDTTDAPPDPQSHARPPVSQTHPKTAATSPASPRPPAPSAPVP